VAFKFQRLGIEEIITIKPQSFSDNRGFFFENFKESEFILNGIGKKFIQDNFSHSPYGVLRGLHYQKNPKAQAKLVTVLTGEIFDVAVDIRKNSPTFGKWIGETLSEKDHTSIYIPEGFAHGFCVLSDYADVLYKVNQEYSPEHQEGIMWNDPMINISWPIKNPIISIKDNKLSTLENIDNNFDYESQF
jgi:dTDP-4-dehydrorhamnose 3,5-epimerase